MVPAASPVAMKRSTSSAISSKRLAARAPPDCSERTTYPSTGAYCSTSAICWSMKVPESSDTASVLISTMKRRTWVSHSSRSRALLPKWWMTSPGETPACSAMVRTDTEKPSRAKESTAASRIRALVLRSPCEPECMFNRLSVCLATWQGGSPHRIGPGWGAENTVVHSGHGAPGRLRRRRGEASMTQVAVAQFAPGQDKEENARSVADLTASAAAVGAEVVLLPEYAMFTAPRTDRRYVEAAEPLHGPFVTAVAEAARSEGVYVVVGVNEAEEGGDATRFTNTLVALSPRGERVALYRKIHLYDAFGVRESEVVNPGPIEEPETFTVGDVTFGLQT